MGTYKRLIVNADDFGRSPGVNRGVIKAYERGIVTSASLMVRHSGAAAAAGYGREHPGLSLGLHVDLGEWLFREGAWIRAYDVVPLNDPKALSDEVSRQLGVFRQLVGMDPSHIDSHQDVHRSDPVTGVLQALSGDLGVPLRHDSPAIRHCGEFYGQTSKGFPLPDRITVDAMIAILRLLGSGCTELACHPADTVDLETGYDRERVDETAVLCDPRVRAALVTEGIGLRSFVDIERAPAATSFGGSACPAPRAAAETPARLDSDADETAVAEAIATWRAGDRRGARRCLESTLGVGTSRAARAVAELYLAVDDPKAAWAVMEPMELGPTDGERTARVAHRLWGAGHLTSACKAFDRALMGNQTDPALAHWRDEVRGQSQVLQGAWAPVLPQAATVRPQHGKVLHLVSHSVPYDQTGYSLRTHRVALAQKRVGLDPEVASQLGFPWDRRVEGTADVDTVRYHRMPVTGGIPSCLDARLSRNLSHLRRLVDTTRPAVLHAASDFVNALLALELRRLFHLPVVYEVRGFWEETWLSTQPSDAAQSDRYRWSRELELQCMIDADRW